MIAPLIKYLIIVLLWPFTAISFFFKFRYFYDVLASQTIPKWRDLIVSMMISSYTLKSYS